MTGATAHVDTAGAGAPGSTTDGEGAGNLHLRDNPERVAEIMACLEPARDRLFKAARKAG